MGDRAQALRKPVIPAKAGIQSRNPGVLDEVDSRLRGNDGLKHHSPGSLYVIRNETAHRSMGAVGIFAKQISRRRSWERRVRRRGRPVRRLRPRVDEPVAEGRIPHPSGDEPPPQHREPALRPFGAHRRHRLARGRVVPGPEVRDSPSSAKTAATTSYGEPPTPARQRTGPPFSGQARTRCRWLRGSAGIRRSAGPERFAAAGEAVGRSLPQASRPAESYRSR